MILNQITKFQIKSKSDHTFTKSNASSSNRTQSWFKSNHDLDLPITGLYVSLSVCLCVVCMFSEEMFPRLGQMIVDFPDPPIKKLSEEFIPHARVITIDSLIHSLIDWLTQTVSAHYQSISQCQSWSPT